MTIRQSIRRTFRTVGASRWLLLAAVASVLVACPCRGADPAAGGDWLKAELAVFGNGASAAWTAPGDIGGTSTPGSLRGPSRGESVDVGRKVKAGLLSLLLPGAGQLYNGDRQKALAFAGVEAAVWASYITFDAQGDSRAETYREWATIYADVAGESHDEDYWRAVGRYMDSDAYNEALLREARALAEDPVGLIGPEAGWQWTNADRQSAYQALRADATRAYSRRDFMTLFAILNRVVAVYDAVRNSVGDRLKYDVLGFQVEFNVNPSLRRPSSGCVISHRF